MSVTWRPECDPSGVGSAKVCSHFAHFVLNLIRKICVLELCLTNSLHVDTLKSRTTIRCFLSINIYSLVWNITQAKFQSLLLMLSFNRFNC